jgi:hypothetical protein
VEYLLDKSQQDLAHLCMGHLDDVASLALTILNSCGAGTIILLFYTLATYDLRDSPDVSEFMKGVLRPRSPHAEANQVMLQE